MMVLMFGIFYFLLIRPQVKRQKEHQKLLERLDKGDMVVTRGGLVGKISGTSGSMLTIELQEKVRVRVMRSHVEGKFDPSSAETVQKAA
ncbi:preprotein translocase subunit YajC [Haliangium ochraceum]|nr:preprotein translocase subunit YajC [Haliangium ochraceum]